MSRITLMALLLASVGTPLTGQSIEAVGYQGDAARATRVAREASEVTERLTGAIQAMQMRGSRSPVTYTLSGRIPSPGGTTTGLPIGIVNAVRDDTHLTSLNVSSRGAATGQFNAIFGFANLAEFDAWYSTPPAQNLHRAVESAAGPEGSVSVNLSVNQGSADLLNSWSTPANDHPTIDALTIPPAPVPFPQR